MSCVISLQSLSKAQISDIRKMLTIYEIVEEYKGRSKVPTIISLYRCEGDNLYLPFHFAIIYLGKFFNDTIQHKKADIKFTGELRDYQKPICEIAYEELRTKGSTTLGVYPGFGKTIVAAYLSSRLKLKTAVVVSVKTLIKQWVNTFETYTTCKICVVDKKKIISEDYDVYICMAKQVKHIQNRNLIGHVVFDEAHLLCTKSNEETWLHFHPKYITIESATLDRDDGFDKMAKLVAGEHIIYRQNDTPFVVCKFNTKIKPIKVLDIKDNDGRVISREMLEYPEMIKHLNLNEQRNNIIIELVKNNMSRKILILTKRIEHCELLKEMIIENNISCDTLCANKKDYVDGKVLIGTVPKIGTGFDQDAFCDNYDGVKFDFLILACYIKKINLLNQCVGRVFRSKEPIVVQLLDDNQGFRNIWNKNKKWYLDRNATIIEK